MGLEDLDLGFDSSEGLGNSKESSTEQIEKNRETAKKASAGVQRTQKDERKAKRYDLFLAGFLVKIILDKKYDFILENLFKTSDAGFTSNIILGILSLINKEISDRIRLFSKKPDIIFNYKGTDVIEFNDNNLPEEVKYRINCWIEDIIDSVIIEYSNIQTGKIILLLDGDTKIIENYIANVMMFFFEGINIKANKKQLNNISIFILKEISKSLQKISIEKI